MSYTYEVNILCDGNWHKEKCIGIIAVGPVEFDDLGKEIQRELAAEGWIVRNGKHYCPICSKKFQ